MGLLPPAPSRRRTTILAFIAVVAVIVVLGLTAAIFGSGVTKPPSASQSPHITNAQNLTVDSFSFHQNSTGETICNVTVTNHENSNASLVVNVIIGQGGNLTSGQPYPTRQPPLNNPSFNGNQNASLGAGETGNILVMVNTPESLVVDASMIFVSVENI